MFYPASRHGKSVWCWVVCWSCKCLQSVSVRILSRCNICHTVLRGTFTITSPYSARVAVVSISIRVGWKLKKQIFFIRLTTDVLVELSWGSWNMALYSQPHSWSATTGSSKSYMKFLEVTLWKVWEEYKGLRERASKGFYELIRKRGRFTERFPSSLSFWVSFRHLRVLSVTRKDIRE